MNGRMREEEIEYKEKQRERERDRERERERESCNSVLTSPISRATYTVTDGKINPRLFWLHLLC